MSTAVFEPMPGFRPLDLRELREEYLEIDDSGWLDEFALKLTTLLGQDSRVRYNDPDLNAVYGDGEITAVNVDGYLEVKFNDSDLKTLLITEEITVYSPTPFKPWHASKLDQIEF